MEQNTSVVPVIIVTEWEGPGVSVEVTEPTPAPAPPAPKKNKKISFSAARVHVVEVRDENNNADLEPNCWFKFLSVVCAWRVRCGVGINCALHNR